MDDLFRPAPPDAISPLKSDLKSGNLDDGLVDVKWAAQFLDVSRSTIYKLFSSGGLKFIKINRSVRIRKRDLYELIR